MRYRDDVISREQARIFALALLCAAGGCGGGGGAPAAFTVVTSPPSPSAGALTVAPASLPGFTLPGQTATLTVSEPQYGGSFTAVADPASCAPNGATVATVSPAIAPASSATFTVTSGGASGICTIAVTDANGHSQSVPVTVTLTQGTLQ